MRTGLHNDLYVSATKYVKTKLLRSNPRRVGVSWKWLRAAQWIWKYMHIAGMGTIRGYDEKTHQSDGLLQPSQNTFVPLTGGHPILTMASCAKMGHHGTPCKLASVCNTPQCAELCLPVSPGRSSDHTRWLSELPYARLWPWLTQQID